MGVFVVLVSASQYVSSAKNLGIKPPSVNFLLLNNSFILSGCTAQTTVNWGSFSLMGTSKNPYKAFSK
jgi:hypothetical protein